MLMGYKLWKKEGLQDPKAVVDANEEYRFDMDSVGAFIKEVMEIDATGQKKLPNNDLYEVYLLWCGRNNERQLGQKSLAIRLQEKGFKRRHSCNMRYWEGLGIRPQWYSELVKKRVFR